MEWFALKHALLSHLPVATGLLLPWALAAAQRPGRGIRPWWTVCRYLGWTGLIGLAFSLVSGLAMARQEGLLPAHRTLPALSFGGEPEALLFRHALLGSLALLVALAAVWAMNRPRKDHESLGLVALALGLAWAGLLLGAGAGGYRLAHERPRSPVPVQAAPPAPKVVEDSSAGDLAGLLDYGALEPLHAEPVKSPAHGGRWIRAWISPSAAASYRAGQPLPLGARVVLSSLEDRWGRPSLEAGPLYGLEMKAEGPTLMFYWPRVPMDRRREFGGESRVLWRGGDAPLAACRACHAGGSADPAHRSRWRVRRLPEGE